MLRSHTRYSQENSPIQNQNLLREILLLHLSRCNRDIVKETESHVLIRLRVMSWRAHDRERVPHLPGAHRPARLDDAAA